MSLEILKESNIYSCYTHLQFHTLAIEKGRDSLVFVPHLHRKAVAIRTNVSHGDPFTAKRNKCFNPFVLTFWELPLPHSTDFESEFVH